MPAPQASSCVAANPTITPTASPTWLGLLSLPPHQLSPALLGQLIGATGLAHVALIMDGNRRWAKQRQLPTLLGHHKGSQRFKQLLRFLSQTGLNTLSVYAFSTENWKRSPQEVQYLMELMAQVLRREVRFLQRHGIRLSLLGEAEALPAFLQQAFAETMAATAANTGLHVQVAVNYGARQALVAACQRVAERVATQGPLSTEAVEAALASTLPVDLLIRPGGEQRLSNFLLWEAAYAELYFTPTLWPDFTPACFAEALQQYAQRQRRFGQ